MSESVVPRGVGSILDTSRIGDDDELNVGANRHLPPAVMLGPYRVLEPLGQGGMGVVYRARHSVTERPVAIKTVFAPASRWMESIRREIDALTRIRHPGVVRILDHGLHEGRPWYAMDLLEGESLRHFGARIWSPYRTPSASPGPIRPLTITEPVSRIIESVGKAERAPDRPLAGDAPAAANTLPQVLGLVRRLCAALAFLHGEGIVSCDLKPENILLVGLTPVLIDFGLSRRFPGATGRESLDGQRSLAGTLPYMSPEQARGELVDARSDLYSVGCIIYELLTGAPPFTGSPYRIRTQHQSTPPTPPSRLVRDVPPALEELVLRLLQKRANDRVGFADEVAAILGDIAGDNKRIPEFPPARPYLYRPRFVGREDTLSWLVALRDAACHGAGALVLVGGESGAGKTRLALELTRATVNSGLRVVASEAQPMTVEDSTTATTAPLHVVRPLLRAIADRCQEAGPEATERLLGDRRSVLAQYEPLMADVPAHAEMPPVVALDPEASRLRLLRYVAESLSAFAIEQPLLWILDDLGWADDLSLAFFRALTSEYFAATPALLVGLYRTEELTEAMDSLVALPHVLNRTLAPLEQSAVSAMIADMLAAPGERADFASYVAGVAEGNPFFVTEHVRTAVGERLFYRDQKHEWRMRSNEDGAVPAYEALPLPRSLRALVERRLRALSELAQGAAHAAAVLGREFAAEIFTEVADLSPEASLSAVNELVRRHVLEQSGAEHLRFVHDKVREVAYGAAPARLSDLHARAAGAIEARWGTDAEHFAMLGYHFAAAGQPDPAARYLKRAADHARSTFANVDAIALYRRAIAIARDAVLASAASEDWRALLLDMREALGDVLALGVDREAARSEYYESLESGGSDVVRGARLHRKIGKTWEAMGHHDRALSSYVVARQRLPERAEALPETRGEWLAARFDELRVHYWLAKAHNMDALVGELRPVVERHGTQEQRAGFYQSQMFYYLGRERYVLSDTTLELSAEVHRVFGAAGRPEAAWAHFQRGFTLLLSRGPDEAEELLSLALNLSRKAGDLAVQARASLYLAVAARMQGKVDEVAMLSPRAASIAVDAGMQQYVAAAKANDAWLSARRGDATETLRLSGEALSDWGRYSGVYPFHWLALLPRLEAQLAMGLVVDAAQSCRALLAPTQRQMPPAAEELLTSAVRACDDGDEDTTQLRIREALDHLATRLLR